MTAEIAATSGRPNRRPNSGVRSWKLWSLPRAALALVIAVELATIVATAVAFSSFRWQSDDFGRFLLVLMLGTAHSELTRRLQRMRSYLSADTVVELNSVWTFASVIVLPVGYAIAIAVSLFALTGFRKKHPATPFRLIYSGAVLVLTVISAKFVALALRPDLHSMPAGPLTAIAICASGAVFFATNLGLVVGVIRLAVPGPPLRDLTPSREEVGLELSTLVLAVLTAEMVLDLAWLTPAILIVMLLLQRSSLVAQLQVAATTDLKTGLLNATAWQELAQRELLRAKRDQLPCAVMLLDLDYFKRVNDTLGHLSGDRALKAVADALKKELRGYDAVARFGGEEFVMFLNDLSLEEARQVARRTLDRIRGLVVTGQDPGGPSCTITASIGIAAYPNHGTEIIELLEAADSALYAAKSDGRDRVSEPRWGVEERVAR
jgi:diguanylate cyclase (GGDEF)-like protein